MVKRLFKFFFLFNNSTKYLFCDSIYFFSISLTSISTKYNDFYFKPFKQSIAKCNFTMQIMKFEISIMAVSSEYTSVYYCQMISKYKVEKDNEYFSNYYRNLFCVLISGIGFILPYNSDKQKRSFIQNKSIIHYRFAEISRHQKMIVESFII